MSIGMVIGPITAGTVIDAAGPLAGLDLTCAFALGIIVFPLCCTPVLHKHLP
jgi:hypothetical protein